MDQEAADVRLRMTNGASMVSLAGVDLGGVFNRNLRLPDADHGEVVVRVYRPWVTAARLASIGAIRQRLADRGLPVVVPIERDEADRAVRVGWRMVELEPFVANDGGTDSFARARAAAELLGRLHGALDGWTPPGPVVPPRVHTALPDRTLRRWLDRTRTIVARRPDHPRAAAALGALTAADMVRTGLATVENPELPRQLTHGDFGHDNLRFVGETPVALLDFDFAGIRPRIADLADLAFAPHWLPSFGQLGQDPADRDWSRIADLIRSYGGASERPPTPAEVEALPVLMARLPVAWAAMGWLMRDPVTAVADLAGELETAAWLLTHRGEVTAGWEATT